MSNEIYTQQGHGHITAHIVYSKDFRIPAVLRYNLNFVKPMLARVSWLYLLTVWNACQSFPVTMKSVFLFSTKWKSSRHTNTICKKTMSGNHPIMCKLWWHVGYESRGSSHDFDTSMTNTTLSILFALKNIGSVSDSFWYKFIQSQAVERIRGHYR